MVFRTLVDTLLKKDATVHKTDVYHALDLLLTQDERFNAHNTWLRKLKDEGALRTFQMQ